MTTGEPGEVLIEAEAIRQRITELGASISADYVELERPLLLVGILRGSLVFLADLCRHISVDVEVDFMSISSYGAGVDSSGAVRILKDLDEDIAARHVLIVEDIVDTGLTIGYLLDTLQARRPVNLRVCTLLDKPTRRRRPVALAYTGFTIEDRFVVGYGMDFAQRFRNLPHVAVLAQDGGSTALPAGRLSCR